MKQRKQPKTEFERHLEANEEAGMPDGAAWALAEEMCGLECGDGIYQVSEDDDRAE